MEKAEMEIGGEGHNVRINNGKEFKAGLVIGLLGGLMLGCLITLLLLEIATS